MLFPILGTLDYTCNRSVLAYTSDLDFTGAALQPLRTGMTYTTPLVRIYNKLYFHDVPCFWKFQSDVYPLCFYTLKLQEKGRRLARIVHSRKSNRKTKSHRRLLVDPVKGGYSHSPCAGRYSSAICRMSPFFRTWLGRYHPVMFSPDQSQKTRGQTYRIPTGQRNRHYTDGLRHSAHS